jgi:hypothetical protein
MTVKEFKKKAESSKYKTPDHFLQQLMNTAKVGALSFEV